MMINGAPKWAAVLSPGLTDNTLVSRRTLCLALDESEHEEFKSEAFFAIGGVAGFGTRIAWAVRRWRAMKTDLFGGPDQPVDASSNKMSREQIDGISAFFEKGRLYRFAYIIKRPVLMTAWVNARHILRPMLIEDFIREIAHMPTLPSDIVISIEQSYRLLPKMVKAFPGTRLTVDGSPIPMVGLFTPKFPPQPLLEMADHVTWRAQRQYMEYSPRTELMPEFVSVFPRGARHARFKELGSILGRSYPWTRADWRPRFASA